MVSPCVAFNNHAGSTKSYDHVREHNEAVNRLDVMPPREPITADYEPGTVDEVTQHDGSVLRLRKLAPDYDPRDRIAAHGLPAGSARPPARSSPACSTSIPTPSDLHDQLGTVDTPLNRLGEAELCPGAAALEAFNAAHR